MSSRRYFTLLTKLAKFGSNVKDLLDKIPSNYSIIIDEGKRHEDYVRQIFRDLLSGKNSTINSFIESTKDDWDTISKLCSGNANNRNKISK